MPNCMEELFPIVRCALMGTKCEGPYAISQGAASEYIDKTLQGVLGQPQAECAKQGWCSCCGESLVRLAQGGEIIAT